MNWPDELIWIMETESEVRQNVLFPFALDEVWCRRIGESLRPAVHIWHHPSALILGLRDRKLPRAQSVMAGLKEEGLQVVVRNSGGAVVPLDDGVVNVSLLLPLTGGKTDFRDDFQYVVEWIAGTVQQWSGEVRFGEIAGAYCPGDFDLSIDGKKFCGISQRRQAKGFSVQAFVNVEGSGERRAGLAAKFYRSAADGADRQAVYPQIECGRTASLEELCGLESAQEFASGLRIWLEHRGIRIVEQRLAQSLIEECRETADKLRLRYDA